jgi:hypothetical protein
MQIQIIINDDDILNAFYLMIDEKAIQNNKHNKCLAAFETIPHHEFKAYRDFHVLMQSSFGPIPGRFSADCVLLYFLQKSTRLYNRVSGSVEQLLKLICALL